MKHLLIITLFYPSPAKPTQATFVREVVHSFARNGLCTTVIQPTAIHKALDREAYPYHTVEAVEGGHEVQVYRPAFFSLSARDGFEKFGPLNPCFWTLRAFVSAAKSCILNEKIQFDAIYGHFIYLSGVAACILSRKMRKPAFPCVGEGEFWTVRKHGTQHAITHLHHAAGILANSTELKRKLVVELQQDPTKIGVFPNGTDHTRFTPLNKGICRENLGFQQNSFLVCSVGNFLYKKGVSRVGKAIEGLKNVEGVFIGSGPDIPSADNTAFCGRVPHDQLPLYLSSADVFVLPTLIEGSCNAIVEAMACGLPIISSNGAFNDDLLTPEMSVRVDPLDMEAIRDAIILLRDNPDLRKRMATASLAHSRNFCINDRAKRMIAFMKERV